MEWPKIQVAVPDAIQRGKGEGGEKGKKRKEEEKERRERGVKRVEEQQPGMYL